MLKNIIVDDSEYVKNKNEVIEEYVKEAKKIEMELIPLLNKYFSGLTNRTDNNIKRNSYKYALFDYNGDKYKYELKDRSKKYSSYDMLEYGIKDKSKGCVIFNLNKYNKANVGDCFISKFKDVICYYRFKKNKRESKFHREEMVSRTDRNKDGVMVDKKDWYIYIPVEDMIIIKNISETDEKIKWEKIKVKEWWESIGIKWESINWKSIEKK
jgi:hypothetical protein